MSAYLTPAEWTRLWRAAGNGISRLGNAAEEFDHILAERMADAWDEGHHAGVYNATDDSGEPFRDNPYRRSGGVRIPEPTRVLPPARGTGDE
jgi:hypothetical protein